MATSYKTPGVYIEEIPKFPPSVAEVETAIPVFVGHTRQADRVIPDDLQKKPFRISSFLEYETYYGDAYYQDITVTVDANKVPVKAEAEVASPYLMYHAVRNYFDNGGGPCYIFSVGNYPAAGAAPQDSLYDDSGAQSALNQIKKVDEITLLVFPDLAALKDADKYYNIYKKALLQCGDLKDRFSIIDVLPAYINDDVKKGLDLDKSISGIRNGMGTSELKYGAAYFPYLKTTYNYSYLNSNVKFQHGTNSELQGLNYDDLLLFINASQLGDVIKNAMEEVTKDNKADKVSLINRSWDDLQFYIVDENKKPIEAVVKPIQDDLDKVITEINADNLSDAAEKALNDEIKKYVDSINKDKIQKTAKNTTIAGNSTDKNITALSAIVNSAFQARVSQVIGKLYVELPPSAAMAGLYAFVDRTRGVWKAPANVSVQSCIEPVFKISDAEQTSLNVHDTGKSINVIRSFTGRGVQVWGARTLAGNDNEWRYISVRRFFNMVEESVKKATEPFVFEPNDANTWVKVKGMIENFLILQWRAGALAGAKPEQAFYVAVGLNQTMTALDILEGRMIVEIGLAVVRPAEFIILRFSHKMQES
jgi:Bacteriophage tail sheath protein